MPSTVVHVAFGLLLAAGLLGRAFDRRAVVVVAAAAAAPDLDVFVSLLVASTHRAAFHTFLLPLALAGLLYYDACIADDSWIRDRYGSSGVHVVWASIAAFAVAGIGLDMFTLLGVNVLYPMHDQFVSVNGHAGYSTVDGVFQSFVNVTDGASSGGGGGRSVDVGQRGSTRDVHVGSGVDPSRGREEPGVRRIFPVAYRGWQLTLIVASVLVTWVRLRGRDAESLP